MVECATRAWGVRGSGWRGTVRVEAEGWWPESTDQPSAVPCPPEATAGGVASRLTVPGRGVVLYGPRGRRDPDEVAELPSGEYLLAVDAPVQTVVGFHGPVRLEELPPTGHGGDAVTRPETEGGLELVFDGRSPVTVGFRESSPEPPTVTVPRSPAGVATALTHASAALRSLRPDRSHPASRAHPPLVAFGDRRVPDAVVESTPETGIEFVGPAAYDWLYVVAPLAYYLGATVRVDPDRERPVLRAPDAGVDRPFDDPPAFDDEAARLLRRSFLLDCLSRDRDGDRLRGRDLLADLGLSASGLRAASPQERLARQLAAPFDAVDPALPEWPLATYVTPTSGTARDLPHLLARLSLVYLASASEMDGEAVLDRAFRGPARGRCGPAGDVAEVDRLDPDLRPGVARLHGWHAEGVPVGAFKSTVRGYRHALDAGVGLPGLEVAVVCNDPEMCGERCVADSYRESAPRPGVAVHVHEQLTVRRLAELFARPYDLVHYVGHCEAAGIRCSDGYLPAADLDTVRARAFVLNACGSYREGRELVRRGSVAGAVTLTTVFDGEATTVGTTLADLLAAGYPFERALSLARREIAMGGDYTVVGDGTHSLVPDAEPPPVLSVSRTAAGEPRNGRESGGGADAGDDPRDGGRYTVLAEAPLDRPGATAAAPLGGDRLLAGTAQRATMDREALQDLLEGWSGPIRHDGRLWSPAELRADLASRSG